MFAMAACIRRLTTVDADSALAACEYGKPVIGGVACAGGLSAQVSPCTDTLPPDVHFRCRRYCRRQYRAGTWQRLRVPVASSDPQMTDQ
jgi:hypothetical protein